METIESIQAGVVYEAAKTIFTEKDLILGIIWEGDLEIHSNRELMKASSFGERIAHGDSIAAKAMGFILGTDCFWGHFVEIKEIEYTFLSPVYIEDQLKICFQVNNRDKISNDWIIGLDFLVFKGDKYVLKGNCTMLAKKY